MKAHQFKEALTVLGWRGVDAASRLDVSKSYISLIASDSVPVPDWIADALDKAVDAVINVRAGHG